MNYLITGCNSDIGQALSKRLAEQNDVKALLVSRSTSTTIELDPASFRRLGNINLIDQSKLEYLAKVAQQFFDGPFTVIHSVGDFWFHRPLDEFAPNEARTMMESHYLTLYGVIYAMIPIMRTLGGGHFIAFSCNSVMANYPEMAPFTSAKAAIESLIKCVANEYSGEGIQANALALPTIRTPKVEQLKKQGDLENYVTPEELAQIVIEFLASSSNYVNGNVIRIFRHSRSFYHEAYFFRNPSGRSKTNYTS